MLATPNAPIFEISNPMKAVIYAVRPVLLHLARNSREKQGESQNEPSPTLKQLAEICVQAASKSLVILQHLREQDILGW